MSRWRWMAALGVVALLAGVVVAVGVSGQEVAPTTTVAAVVTTSTSVTSTSTSTTISTTTTTSVVVDREAEVEAILQELWFGWFDAIYRKDEEALRRVVATEDAYQDGLAAMETMEFTATPTLEGTQIEVLEILRDDAECVVSWAELDFRSFLGQEGVVRSVDVLRLVQSEWRLTARWSHPNDLWETDCDARLLQP